MGETRQKIRGAIRSCMTVVVILAIIILAGLFAASFFGNSSPSVYRPPSQTANVIKWTGIGLLSGISFLMLSIFLGGALAAIGGGFFALGKGLRAFRESRTNATDPKGFRPAYMEDVAPWWKRLFGFRDFYWQDWDRIKSAAGRVRISPLGNVIAETIDYGASDDEQMLLNRENLRARQIAAGKKTEGKYEVMDRAGLLPYAVSKAGLVAQGLLPGKQPAQAALPATVEPPADRKPPSLVGAIQKVSKPDLFVLGYRYDGLGELVPALWDTYADSLLIILGKSRRGKTSSVGITLGLQMAWHGWQCVILDPEREQSWSVLAPHLEHRRTDADNVIGYVDAYVDEWQRRGELLASHNANDIRDLPPAVRPPSAALIIEEYDKLRRDVLRFHGDDALQHFDAGVEDLAQVGAKRLMRVVLVNQYNSPREMPWPEAVRRQGKKLTFTQEVNDYNLTGYHDLMGLGVGEFAFEGQRWQGFLAAPQVAKVMAKAPAGRSPYVPILTAATGRSQAATGGRNVVPALPTPPLNDGWVGGGMGNGNGNNAPTPAPATPEIVLRSNEEVARLWLAQRADADLPRGWSTQLAQEIATNNDDLVNWNAYKSEAARWKERYHPSGNEYDTYQPADGWPKPHGWPSHAKPDKLSHLDTTDIFGHRMTVLDANNPDDAAELERIRQQIAAGNFDIRSSK